MRIIRIMILALLFIPLAYAIPNPWEYFSFDSNQNGDNGIITGSVAGGIAHLDNCKVGGCYHADGVNKEVNLGQTIAYPDNSAFTISYWANQTSSGDRMIMGDADSTNSHIGFHFASAPNQLRTKTEAGTQYNWAYTEDLNTWHHFVFIANATSSAYYLDGNIISAQGATNDYNIKDFFNGYTSTTYAYVGSIDEICFWNQSLNSDDIADLYNSGDGVADCTGTAPSSANITFIYPTVEDGKTNNTQVNISFNSSSGYADFYFGNTNPPTVKYFDNVSTPYYWQTNVTADGTYYYYAGISDGSVNTSVRTWTYDTTDPTITINTANGFTSNNGTVSNPYKESLEINITTVDNIDLSAFLINITDSSGVEKFSYTNESLSGFTFNYTNTINVSTWATDEIYTVKVFSADSHTTNKIDDYTYKETEKELSFTTAEGNNIRVVSLRSADWTVIKKEDRYSFEFAPYTLDALDKYKFMVYCDNGLRHITTSGYKGHFVCMNWETKKGNWLDFEGTNTPVSVTDEGEGWYEIEVEFEGDKVTFESIGGLNINEKHYQWYKGKSTPIADDTLSGSPFTLYLNVTHTSGVSAVYAGLSYNNTDYSPNVTRTPLTDYTIFSAQFSGFGVNDDSTYNVSWNVSYIAEGDGTNGSFHRNTTHSILTFVIDNCAVGAAETRVFRIFNENEPSIELNGTVVIDGTYWGNNTDNKTLNISYAYVPASLCMSPPGLTLYGDLYIKYTVPTGFTHRWFIVNGTFTNVSETIQMGNYNDTTGISDLKITVRRVDNYKFFSNVIGKLQRRYNSEGVWRTVQQDKSGDYGLLFYNIREEDTDYRIIFIDTQNNILKTTASVKFVCNSGVCEITQQLNPYDTTAASITPSISHTFDNSTRLLTVSWVVPSGDSVTLDSYISKETLTGTAQICSSSASGSSGSIVCNTTGYDGVFSVLVAQNGIANYAALQEAPPEKLSDFVSVAESSFWSFGILVTVVSFGAVLGPAGAAISTVLALIIVFLLNISNAITLGFIGISAVLGLLVAIKVRQ